MKYDVIIVGGGTAGCAAAYTSAVSGLKTLLIEKNSFLGGSMTGGLVTPAMKSSDNQINTNFFNLFIDELKTLGGGITYFDGNSGWFNPELAKIALDRLLLKAGVEIRFNSYVTDIEVKNGLIASIKISNAPLILSNPTDSNNKPSSLRFLSECIETRYMIDTTASQDICNALNCDSIDDNGNIQPSSLRFIASGINLQVFKDFILEFDSDRNATTGGSINGEIHLSTACTSDKDWALTPMFNEAVEKGILKPSDTAYFQIFTIPGMHGSVAFNCPRFVQSDDENTLKTQSTSIIEAREAMLRLLEFCKIYFPGFDNAYISNIATMVGHRVSKRALGEYFYTIEDLKSGKKFDNPVLISNYPIDVHSNKKENVKLEKVLQEYQLPIEALHSSNYKNLYFAGRSISADFFAQAALRIIPSCFSMGEGLAKYIATLGN